MQENLVDYLQKQIFLEKEKIRSKTHSRSGFVYPKRYLFPELEQSIRNFIEEKSETRFILVPGLRGVGKTTLLAQLYHNLYSIDAERLFLSLDELKNLLGVGLQETIEAFERLKGFRIEELKKPFFLFLDEVQADENWSETLKVLYDRNPWLFIFVSGSSALELQSSADLQRRMVYRKLYPLGFIEYLQIKQLIEQGDSIEKLQRQMQETLFGAKTSFEDLKQLFVENETVLNQFWTRVDPLNIDRYLAYGSLPFALEMQNPNDVYESVKNLIEKIVYQDLKKIESFDLKTLASVKRLLFILSDASEVPSLTKLSEALSIDRLTLRSLFDSLEKTELLIRAKPLASGASPSRKASKYLFNGSLLRSSFLDITGSDHVHREKQGLLLEDTVASYLYKEFISKGFSTLNYDAREACSDFLLNLYDKKRIAIEIGIGKKDSKQLIKTMNKVACDYGLLISSSKLFVDEEHKILRLPLRSFLILA